MSKPSVLVPHPYLGFTVAPGTRVRDQIGPDRARRLAEPASIEEDGAWLDTRANNHGFYSDVDYPWTPPPDRPPFVVGLFGASVGMFLSLQLGRELSRDLEASGRSALDRVAVLNFAQGGMKQPQNLLTLTFLLALGQRIDAAVFVDGFGPAALSFRNVQLGYAPDAPSIKHLGQVADVSGFRLGTTLDANDEAAIATAIVASWERSTRQFHSLCHAQQIRLVHLLQPNQYDGIRGRAPAERGLATTPHSEFGRGVELVFPRLRASAAALTSDGVPVVDATRLFDDMPDAVFADSCCHYNLRGMTALKNLVVDHLLRAVGEASVPATG